MRSANGPLATSGFVGALTALIVSVVDKAFPDNNLKSLIAVGAGMLASLIWFEVASWFVVRRLRATQRALDAILPQFEQLQTQLQQAVDRQIAAMRVQNAPAQLVRDLEKDIAKLNETVARAMIEITHRSLDIIRSLGQ